MTKGIKHKDIGEDLSRTEFEADDSHELESGTSFPGSPVEKDRFYRTDLHRWYIYNGTAWKIISGALSEDLTTYVRSTHGGTSDNLYSQKRSFDVSTILATITPTFAVASMAVGVATVLGCRSSGTWRLRLEMDGVVVAESANLTDCDGANRDYTYHVIVGTKALVGAKVCLTRLYEVVDGSFYTLTNKYGDEKTAACIAVGSVKL